jgi:hypothetical protein
MLDEENCSPSNVDAVRRAERMVDMHINQFYAAVHSSNGTPPCGSCLVIQLDNSNPSTSPCYQTAELHTTT